MKHFLSIKPIALDLSTICISHDITKLLITLFRKTAVFFHKFWKQKKFLSLVTNFMLLNVYLLWLNFEFLVYFGLYKLNQRAHNEFNLSKKTPFFSYWNCYYFEKCYIATTSVNMLKVLNLNKTFLIYFAHHQLNGLFLMHLKIVMNT